MQRDDMVMPNRTGAGLLRPDDPDPVGCENPDGKSPVLLICEHGGRAIPGSLGDLGVSRDDMDSHIGWDVGALPVALAIAEALDAPLIHQRYSRLVYDCNRPPGSAEATPSLIHGISVPGNRDLSRSDIAQRRTEIFDPYDAAVTEALKAPRLAAFSIHSFTPKLAGQARPWSVGLLSRRDDRTAEALHRSLAATATDAMIARNQPYRIEDASDWFIPMHAERRKLAHCLFEIRNDLLETPQGQELWAHRLTTAVRAVLEDLR